jgi:hypothetical protein
MATVAGTLEVALKTKNPNTFFNYANLKETRPDVFGVKRGLVRIRGGQKWSSGDHCFGRGSKAHQSAPIKAPPPK